MGIFSGAFDFITDSVEDFLGLPGGDLGDALSLIGKAGSKALSSRQKAGTKAFPQIPRFSTQTISTQSRSDAGEVQFYKSEKIEDLYDEWLSRMARFATLQKITER